MNDTIEEGDIVHTVIPSTVDNGLTWAPSFGLSWTDMMLFDQAGPQMMIRSNGQYLRKQASTMGLVAARNEIAQFFLDNTDGEWLFMVDTDMSFAPDTVVRLVQSALANDVKILGALCFAQKLDPDLRQGELYVQRHRIIPTLYRYHEIAGTGEVGFRHVDKYAREAFQVVSATGAGCVLVHRDVLTAVGPDPFNPMTVAGGGGQGKPRTFSEDLSFMIRAATHDFPIGVDTSIKTAHHKGGIFLDETAYAMQQETLIQAKGHEIARNAELYARHNLSPLGVIK